MWDYIMQLSGLLDNFMLCCLTGWNLVLCKSTPNSQKARRTCISVPRVHIFCTYWHEAIELGQNHTAAHRELCAELCNQLKVHSENASRTQNNNSFFLTSGPRFFLWMLWQCLNKDLNKWGKPHTSFHFASTDQSEISWWYPTRQLSFV